MDSGTKIKQCQTCNKSFEIANSDHGFYASFDVPEPVDCPICRETRRLTFRNEKTLYLRDCDLCHRKTVSIYSPDKKVTAYCQTCWWSDQWDQLQHGRDFDFNRPFFEQFAELLHLQPLIMLFGKNSENSEYVNQETDDKNCYMNAGGHYNEDCYHNTYSIWGKNNVDNHWVIRSELLCQCVKCENCFQSSYLQECENCTDCHYSRELKGCNHCFGSYGLRHKEYYFFNEPLEKSEYEKRIREYLDTPEGCQRALRESRRHFLKYPHRAVYVVNCENCSGDDMLNCKNMTEGYLVEKMHDCKYCYIAIDVKDSMDLTSFGWGERLYNLASSGDDYNCMACTSTWSLHFCQYCFVCFNSDYLFGCVGMQRKKYCILNKQYTQKEYEELLPRIIEHMKKTPAAGGTGGEYGQFFDPSISPFGYNETVANQYYPLTKEQALSKKYPWKDPDKKEYLPQNYRGSYRITDVSDDIIGKILACHDCGKNYKIIESELKFYRRTGTHIPTHCPECRQKFRLSLKNPRQLHSRTCAKCGTEIQTTYAPSRPEIVYCEKCYLEIVY